MAKRTSDLKPVNPMFSVHELQKLYEPLPLPKLNLPVPRSDQEIQTEINRIQAEMYIEGLKSEISEMERSLQSDEEVVMICWQGHEKMLVQSVSMPSHNVVTLKCQDNEGRVVKVSGHMNAITFSFRVVKTSPPAKRNPIGFEMPLQP
jgi:hypothetical protein